MSKREATYSIARRGWATAYAESELPPAYAASIKNRFINIRGAVEKRPGIIQFGNDIAGTPTITGIHELVKSDSTSVFMVSSDAGTIYSKAASVSAYTTVRTGLVSGNTIRSVQFDDKLIFYNGVDRLIYTEDGSAFDTLVALIEQGQTATDSSALGFKDSDISNWIGGTDVAVNDLVYNLSGGGYGIVTAVNSANITHTNISTSATGIGITSVTQTNGQNYRVIDLVELNVIPTGKDLDNVATAGPGTSTVVVAVSGVDFSTTQTRVGDYVYNSTRAAVTEITAVSANLNVTSITGQTSGDSLVLLKSAMPIASYAHVHYGRLYMVDSRDKRKIRISGANDPQDMTTDAGTLDSITFNVGALQPIGETIIAMGSFQKFFVFATENNVFAYEGTTPIGAGADFAPVGLFPQGIVSPDGLISLGNDMSFVTHDGLQGFGLIQNSSNLQRANLSEPIRNTLREDVDDTPTGEIVLVHHPERSWLLLKVGTTIYCYSYSVFLGDSREDAVEGAWSFFDGVFASQRAFKVLKDNKLYCAGANGKVYKFDQGTYTDAGTTYGTEYKTGYLTLEEPQSTRRRKAGQYIKPVFSSFNTSYTIRADAPFDGTSSDSMTIGVSGAGQIGDAVIGDWTIGESNVYNPKMSLRWRGEEVRLTFTTNDAGGPDVLSKFTLYANVLGRE